MASRDDSSDLEERLNDVVYYESVADHADGAYSVVREETNPDLEMRPLTSAAACLGSSVLFDCSFEVENPYNYVVWYIGEYVVERSNSQFEVVYKAGEALLLIKSVDVKMAGEVTCELREVMPCILDHQNLLVRYSTCNLGIVSETAIEEEKKTNSEIRRNRKIYKYQAGSVATNMDIDSVLYNIAELEERKTSPDASFDVTITYCRLSSDGIFYLLPCMSGLEVGASVKFDDGRSKKMTITIEKRVLPEKMRYTVEIAQNDGEYEQVGICSEAKFELHQAALYRLIKIRLRPILSQDIWTDFTISIAPQDIEEAACPPKTKLLLTSEELPLMYMPVANSSREKVAKSQVHLVRDLKNGKFYVAKHLRTSTDMARKYSLSEFSIMSKMQHPKVIDLVAAFYDEPFMTIVMEYLWGGELFDRVASEEHIQEEDVVSYVRQICEALAYIHKKNVVHLDIKPENIVCCSPNSCQIKLIDFGLSRTLRRGYSDFVVMGTQDYIPPEVLNHEPVSAACDMWSLGVVTYILLSGITPFYAETWPEMTVKINRAEYNYDDEAFDNVSLLSRDFVDRLLLLNRRKRLTAQEALQHEWLRLGPPKGPNTRLSMRRACENLKTYLANYRSKWRCARNVMIAAHRLRTLGHSRQNSAN